jgi:hypothetical protein
MGTQRDAFKHGERMISPRRLESEDVKTRAGDTFVQGVEEGFLVDKRSTGCVDEDGAALQHRQAAAIEKAFRPLG